MNSTHHTVPDWPGDPDAHNEISADLVDRLVAADGPADEAGTWSEALWRIVEDGGMTRWSLPRNVGGAACLRAELVRRYARIAEGSLTAAFVLTQHDAAVRRHAAAAERGGTKAGEWLEAIADRRLFPTVGISQLTTSRRHGAQALVATETETGRLRLDGIMPWVTAAARADLFVTGAVLADFRQVLIALPASRPGIEVQPPFSLAALQASCTSEVICRGVVAEPDDVIAGPTADVMASPGQGGTGGLETSALALGQARAALVALAAEGSRRDDLQEPLEALASDWASLAGRLIAAAEGESLAPAQIRAAANAFVLRATQAYLTARKGTGFLKTESAQRWARQALFFLVWSCPAPVAQAAIRDLAGLCAG
jgi:alkylation response protein AidB-like acyl-CoA dehydrogenase